MSRRRVVVIAPMLPYDGIPHAGGQYLRRITELLDDESDLTVLVPNTPTNRATDGKPGTPQRGQVVGADRATAWHRRALARALAVLDRWGRRLDPGLASLPMAAALARPGPARDALGAADVVGLEWSESIRLAGLVRRLNPDARLVGTFHDVQSQLFAREPADRWSDRLYWQAVARRSRRHERRAVAALDEVWVFSDKDAALLGDRANVRTVHPPLATGRETRRPPAGPPRTVLFVANLSRAENDAGARWLLTEIWPDLVGRCPDARLRIVGVGASDALAAMARGRDEVTLAGYVDDLAAEYAGAWAVVVPLRQGAGVKFKTIEALLHDVPTVTTTVGAEGITGRDLFAGLHDEPSALGAALAHVLDDPDAHRARSAAAQAWARATYGPDAFRATLRTTYRLG